MPLSWRARGVVVALALASGNCALAQVATSRDAYAASQSDAGAVASSLAERWRFGAVFDVAYTSQALALGARDRGLELGHSDLTASGPLGRYFVAQANAVLATHDGRLEADVEELWLETVTLPLGAVARVGRFASQIGRLNEQHPHADDFVERPLLYRAFFGGHWNDDGARLNITLPTELYAMIGVEAFRGKRLVEAAQAPKTPGAYTVVAKVGGDVGRAHSWQLGASYVRNRRLPATDDHASGDHGEDEEPHGDDEDGDDDHAHQGNAHDHAHGARFTGRNIWMVDATWKWAPEGNNQEQQVRVAVEAAYITDTASFDAPGEEHRAAAVSAVWRFHPNWEIGVRTDWLSVAVAEDDHFTRARLREHSLMVAWKPSHLQSLRLQYARQSEAVGFDRPAKNAVQLQYVISFGAHGAHSF